MQIESGISCYVLRMWNAKTCKWKRSRFLAARWIYCYLFWNFVFVFMNCEMWNACFPPFTFDLLLCSTIRFTSTQRQAKKKNHPTHELTEIFFFLRRFACVCVCVRAFQIFRALFKRIMMCDFAIHSNHFFFPFWRKTFCCSDFFFRDAFFE